MAEERLVLVNLWNLFCMLIILVLVCFSVLHPLVVWAQRKDLVFMTIRLEDTISPEIKLDEENMYFRYSIKNATLKHALFLNLFSFNGCVIIVDC